MPGKYPNQMNSPIATDNTYAKQLGYARLNIYLLIRAVVTEGR